MTMAEVVAFISSFAVVAGAPVRTHTTVTSVTRTDDGYCVAADTGDLRCRSVVLASGACNVASVPAVVTALPAAIASLTALDYRNPHQLSDGGVLIVGASATGVQLAEEIQRSGRQVTIAVGEHVRLPRTYRGRDVLWWMDASGVWNQRYDEVDDLARARRIAVTAAGRNAGAHDARSQHARRGRRRDCRPPGRHPRRPGALFGRTAQSVRARRPQARAAAGYIRRMGAQQRTRCRRRPAGAFRTDTRACRVATLARSRTRRDPDP